MYAYMCRERILEQPHSTAMLFQHGCSFTLPPIDSTQVGGITVLLKLACYLLLASLIDWWYCCNNSSADDMCMYMAAWVGWCRCSSLALQYHIYWLVDWLINWLLVDWLKVQRFVGWLIDWLIDLWYCCNQCCGQIGTKKCLVIVFKYSI